MALEGTSPGRWLTRAQDGVGAVKRCLHVFSAPDGGVPEHVLELAIGLRGRGWGSWVGGPETAKEAEMLTLDNATATSTTVRLNYDAPQAGLRHGFSPDPQAGRRGFNHPQATRRHW
jgi:hypothetical protein